jgi:hypothetical protein
MKASLFYRIAAVLLLLFAAGHTFGFSQPPDPTWGADALVGSMKSIRFDVQGFNRTYWDFFVAAGYTVGVLYLFAAILAWQLGSLPPATLALMRGTTWAFALCFAVIAIISWRRLFCHPHRFLNRGRIVSDCGSMAFSGADGQSWQNDKLAPVLCPLFTVENRSPST